MPGGGGGRSSSAAPAEPPRPVTGTSRPRPRLVRRAPGAAHVTPSGSRSGRCPGLTETGGLGRRALVHEHLLVLAVSSGHKLVPLPRWGALRGKRPGAKLSAAGGARGRPGKPSGRTGDGGRTLCALSLGPPAPPRPHTQAVPSLSTTSWSPPSAPTGFSCSCLQRQCPGDERRDTSPVQMADWGGLTARGPSPLPACLPSRVPCPGQRRGWRRGTVYHHLANQPSPHGRPCPGPAC